MSLKEILFKLCEKNISDVFVVNLRVLANISVIFVFCVKIY